MKTNDSETVREVCAEMCDDRDGEYFPFTAWEIKVTKKVRHLLKVLAGRFLSAYEREMAAKDAEIARLKASLKPVMECEFVIKDDGEPLLIDGDPTDAVREAQRIILEEWNYKVPFWKEPTKENNND